MIWSIDDKDWNYPCTVERTGDIESSDISGVMLDRNYFNDVIGTYMSYDVKIAVPREHEQDYYEIYEMLTDPVGWHSFLLPYNDGTIEITGRIESVKDVYVKLPNGVTWRGIQFEVISNTPTKKYTLDEIVAMGRMPLPSITDAEYGDAYYFGGSGWVELEDADDYSY